MGVGRLAALAGSAAATMLGMAWVAMLAWQGRLGGAAAVIAIGTCTAYVAARRSAPASWRATIDNLAKTLLTVIGTVGLLRHPIPGPGNVAMPIYTAIATYIRDVDPGPFLFFALLAMLIKVVGMIASAYAWHLLLIGQGIRFPFWSGVLSSFLIGRFIGTFLPSTLGLDGYTLYEASRYSNQWSRTVTAKALEKVIGTAGLFAAMVITLPFGYVVIRDVADQIGRPQSAPALAALIFLVGGGISLAVLITLLRPTLLTTILSATGRMLPTALARRLDQIAAALGSYSGQTSLLLVTLGAKVLAHFATAVVYYLTALAIGVVAARFWPIVFGSTIQILGTLLSPTIAGEGAREAFQALLLSNQLGGVAQAVLSAAVGFLAAEASTLWGGALLWWRTADWRPKFVIVDGSQVDYRWLTHGDGASPSAAPLGGRSS